MSEFIMKPCYAWIIIALLKLIQEPEIFVFKY